MQASLKGHITGMLWMGRTGTLWVDRPIDNRGGTRKALQRILDCAGDFQPGTQRFSPTTLVELCVRKASKVHANEIVVRCRTIMLSDCPSMKHLIDWDE